MLIDVLTRAHRFGYLIAEHHMTYLPNNTLCLRRRTIEEIGPYDETLHASEDVEFCTRLVGRNWKLYRSEAMILHHRARRGLPALLKQWWGYGVFLPGVFGKHNPGCLELFTWWPSGRYMPLMFRAGRLTGCVFLHPFLLAHLSIAGALLCHGPIATLSAFSGAAFTYLYLQPDQKSDPAVALVRYLVNWAFLLSNLKGSLKAKCLYLPSALCEPTGALKDLETPPKPSLLQRLVARTDVMPLRFLYRSLYQAGALFLRRQLLRVPGVQGIFLTGSFVSGTQRHGLSDLDFFVLVDESLYEPIALEAAIRRSIQWFPFLGPYEERRNQVIGVKPSGEVENPHFLYRWTGGLTKLLHLRRGLRLSSVCPEPVLLLVEAKLQLTLAAQSPETIPNARQRAIDTLRARCGLTPLRLCDLATVIQALEDVVDYIETLAGPLVATTCPGPVPLQTGSHSQSLGSFLLITGGSHSRRTRKKGSPFSWLPLHSGYAGETLCLTRLETGSAVPSLLLAWMRADATRLSKVLKTQVEQEDPCLLTDEETLLPLLLGGWQLQRFAEDPSVIFKSLDEAWEDLLSHFPIAQELHEQVQGDKPQESCLGGHLLALVRHIFLQQNFSPPASRLNLSLCIVTKERSSWLADLLQTVVEQVRGPEEVLVVDNCVQKSAKDVVESFLGRLPIRYIHSPSGTLGSLRNLAIHESYGDAICFTDDDCLLNPNWLSEVEIALLRDDSIGAVGGRVLHLTEDGNVIDRFHRRYLGVS